MRPAVGSSQSRRGIANDDQTRPLAISPPDAPPSVADKPVVADKPAVAPPSPRSRSARERRSFEPSRGSRFRARYGVPYDTQGPRVRLGILWALALFGSLAYHLLRPYALALVMAVVAAMAAGQLVSARRGDHGGTDRRVAELGASALAVLAALGVGYVGAGLFLVAFAALLAAMLSPEPGKARIGRVGLTTGSAALCGGVAASVVLVAHYEIGAVIVLLTYVLLYDASDFVVGSGASNGIEGPFAGALIAIPVTVIFALLGVPPFHGADVWAFALLTMLACPAGQIFASAVLPSAATPAPALRRLDSLLVAAPLWAVLVGLYLTHPG